MSHAYDFSIIVLIALRCPEDAARRNKDLIQLASEPQSRLIEVSGQYWESRILHIVIDKRVLDLLARHDGESMDIKTLADKPASCSPYAPSASWLNDPARAASYATNETLMQAVVGSAKVA
ncbi:hypothetical protein DL770_007367 [Monosporascus sp. CRB-9-2]|nr:hypothetical protein DL770_007367 [Monosporascus sp. CRB-9-2]